MQMMIDPAPTAGGDLVKDSDTKNFMADVIQASMDVPVVVDFWAPWCGPCKQLGPILEKVVTAARGAVKLVKVDIDQNQQLAQQMRIQSIPAVYAFKGGRPVDGFMGALPESQVKQFVERLIGGEVVSPVDEALEEATALMEEGDVDSAAQVFGEVLQHEPENVKAIGGIAQIHIAKGDLDAAEQTIAAIPEAKRSDPAAAKAISALDLARQTADLGDAAELQRAVEADPANHEARFEFAMALYARGKNEEAADQLLELFRRDRKWNEDAARKQLVKLFEAWGPVSPLTLSVRKRLSTLMFS
jgi:putative thioredoxin